MGGYGVYFALRLGVAISEFVSVGEPQTIGRVELRALLRALNELTMLQPAAILCDWNHIVEGCKGQVKKWQRNDWRTTVGPVKDTDLWKQILILFEVYGTRVAVYHVPSHPRKVMQ